MNRRAEGHGPLGMILDLASRTRNLSAGGLVLALALLSSACGRGSSRTATTLTIHYQGDEWLFGPGYDDDPKMLVFPPLVRWHDGAPVTAQDVAFTYSLWRHPDVRYYAGAIRGEVAVVDGSTLTFTGLESPFKANPLWGTERGS